MQIYGIDLASQKFDVSFVDAAGKTRHTVVKNSESQIERFLDKLPPESRLVAEHTGAYGDLLLMLADRRGIPVSYVSGYEIKHSMGLVRGKSDPVDASRIREYGERHADRLEDTHFPSETLYALREIRATRRLLVEQRKQIETVLKNDGNRPLRNPMAHDVKQKMLEQLDIQIAALEKEIRGLMEEDGALSKNYGIVRSVPGIGPVTAAELIIKTDNFSRVSTAKKCATLAGIAPFPNSTGKSDRGSHVSHLGDKQLKSLLFMCARSAIVHFETMRVYKMKKYDIEHKHIFIVMNNVANRLLKIIYALVKKGKLFDPSYVPRDPRLKPAN